MATQTCSNCMGRGRITDYSQRIQTSPSYYTYGDRPCPTCGGSGEIYKSTSQAAKYINQQPASTNNAKKSQSTSSTTGDSNVQGIFAFIGFLVGSISVYQSWDENLVIAGVAGLVTGYLVGKWYKLIIAVALIIGVVYLLVE